MTNGSTPQPDTDGRELFDPDSRYSPELRKEQKREGIYIGALLAANLLTLAGVGVGTFVSFVPEPYYHTSVLPSVLHFAPRLSVDCWVG